LAQGFIASDFFLVMMRVCSLLVLAAATSVEVSPVQKVIELLDGLKGKVQADLGAEEKLMDEYTNWCDEEENEKTDTIRSNKRTIGDLQATIQESTSRVSQLSSEIEELAAKISSNEADLKKATSIRDAEHSDFTKTEGELSETIDTLNRANVVLSRGQGSFLQKGSQSLEALTNGLSKIIEATWVNSQQKAVVQSLLQSQTSADADDEDLSLQPQASTAAFTSQGGGILDTLNEMKEKAESTLSESRQTEMKSNHAFEMLKNGLEASIKTDSERKNAASTERSATEQALGEAQQQLASTQNTVKADEAYLADLKQNCAAKASEWETRQKDATEEVAVIEKAKSILSEGVTAFLQVHAEVSTKDDSEKRTQVSKILMDLARKNHVYALSQLASHARSDPFGKVRGLVESMIDRLTKEAAEEADAKQFCDAEISKSRAKQEELSAGLDMHAARIEKATAAIAQLKAQTKALSEQMAEMDAAQAESTKIRQEENDVYVKASKDYKDSAEAVANAIQVLQAYYSEGAFVQQAPEFGDSKTDVAGTIVSILEVAESDFTTLLSEAEASESAAKNAYEKLVQANAISRSAGVAEVKGNEDEVKALEASLLNYKEDQSSTNKEMDAVMTYLAKLKPQCETKVMSYGERKARRESEVEGLKEALAILTK